VDNDCRNFFGSSSWAAYPHPELMHAAEAVVDAALITHEVRGDAPVVSEDTRLFLIEAVCEDPSLTPHLFSRDLVGFHWC